MNFAEALVDAMAEEKVDTLFGLLGGGIEEIVALAVKKGMRYVKARHEEGAVGMADGYSRATGRVGVALVSHGAGLSNAGTLMIVARKARSRVLVITSDTAADEPFMPHNFDQELFLSATIGRFITIRSTAAAQRDLERAFGILARGEGPVALNLPTPIASLNVPDSWAYRAARKRRSATNLAPAADAIAEVAALLASAEKPLLVAGVGAVHAGAKDPIIALAERTGAALAETLLAKGWFRGHERSLGVCGGFGDPAAQEVLNQADLVIAFGASMSRYTTRWGTLFGSAAVVTVDTRSDSEPQMTTPRLRITADARLFAEALLAQSAASAPDRPAWTPSLHSPPSPPSTGGGLDLAAAVLALDAALPRGRALVIDGGNAIGPPAALFTVDHPLDQICPWEFWSIGVGVPIAIGASVGRPDRLTVAFLGDGALMLGLSDLDAAVRYGAPLLVVVVDNGSLGAERTSLRNLSLDTDVADVDNPDLASVARSLGFESYTAADPASLEDAISKLLSSGFPRRGPCLLSLRVDKDAPTPEMDRAFESYRPV